MIRLIFGFLKLGVLAAVVLLISQIPVGKRRICDHVYDATQTRYVQRPVHWIAERFVFTQSGKLKAGASHAEAKASRAAGSEHQESDRSRLSGLLK